ncbi:LacI family DNA-binding transcriptional regulator [Pontivivens insulae]|uniref:HTH-type transcriptional regulator DegA n=1 Tax=Pontivivens insulae TaxID=1639689 RepID=A0A2R8AG51_9RHOB|nr:LacI family DNA-binding transcriptional regulator [Pontivivens insulae]RED10613.1 LacI family transcriptional regulator [Pontivivens insulae]SPF31176.1 HTH-type transcriptional regulator DegA [Pontivivens insulae]
MRPTTKDLAKAAGVSLASVDRVLNDRGGVGKKTVAAVHEAIERIGFTRNVSAANLARGKTYEFRFLLPEDGGEFVGKLYDRIDEASQMFEEEGIKVSTAAIPALDAHRTAAMLAEIGAKADGIALMSPDSPQVRDAALRLQKDGKHILKLFSGKGVDEIAPVGIDNKAAGATAAQILGRFTPSGPGEVLVFADTMSAQDSIERRLGFDAFLAERFPNLTALPSLETYRQPARAVTIASNAARNHSNVVAAYVMSPEAAVTVNALKVAFDLNNLTVIAHERTDYTEAALRAGEIDALIAQNPGHVVRSAIRQMRARCENRGIVASQEAIRIEILLEANL